ncbi:RNA deprotection pyrophosphohydrolase [Lentibacillus sp. Marseille-P4043]|uniref:RNA deprotection pyrophosphohydrolase n=1 Tax=Lentibacillus sp. Marseille-P4043 TaxID=2040293 RepID=UPI000D0B4674|nr:nucleoside triphosphatase YtkD [Lentibacillus sp. Marseille-P4043]
MNTFRDYYNNEVKLSFANHPFSNDPKHVWVICKFNDDWLLTKHKDRGLEFPGGKVENDESADQAAIREVMEETGGIVKSIRYIGQYFVAGKGGNIIKNVYFAKIDELTLQNTYYETDGPVLLNAIPKDVKHNDLFSFIMKDGVLTHCMGHIKKNASAFF